MNFDRYAISHSLDPPPAAVVFNAANSATSAFMITTFVATLFDMIP